MPKQLDATLQLKLGDHAAEFAIDLGWESDKALCDLDEHEVFLLSEAIRTTLIHEDTVLHGLVKEIVEKEKIG